LSPNKIKKAGDMRDGFTLIEMLLALAILAVLSAISFPYIYHAVMGIRLDSLIESASLSVRQLIVDARTRSIKEDTVYEFDVSEQSFKSNSGNNHIYLDLPDDFNKHAVLEPEGLFDPTKTYYFVKGLFVEEDGGTFELVSEDVETTIKPDITKYTNAIQKSRVVKITNGLAQVIEYKGEEED